MKNIHIKLNDRWQTAHACPGMNWCGAIFLGDELLSSPQQIMGCLPPPEAGLEILGRSLHQFNGFYALIYETSGRVIIAVDRVRSYPLFYGEKGAKIFLSDDAEWIRKQVGDLEMNPVARDEFRLTGYVTGKNTLYPLVYQLQAGELLQIDLTAPEEAPCISTHRYFYFVHAEPAQWDEIALRQELEQVSHACIDRLVRYANGRQIVIPLSGGYDSRLIATLLCRAGYRNVLTFTYGSAGSREVQYSRQVAQTLQLPWHFVEYSAAVWRHAWATENGWEYQSWASGWASLPHIQDWLAVCMLRRAGHISDDCLFVPGHSGDFVAGSHIPEEAFRQISITPDMLVDKILRQHYCRSTGHSGPRPQVDLWSARILRCIGTDRISLPAEFADAFEKWDWQERQAKFICNAVRVYEFFSYDWWMPLWDAEFVSFWQKVPLALRRKRLWYLNYVQQEYAGLGGTVELRNASDLGCLEKVARTLLNRMPSEVTSGLKALRESLIRVRGKNSYLLSHLSDGEIKKLRRHGYRGNDILVHEFLKNADAASLGHDAPAFELLDVCSPIAYWNGPSVQD